jgi:hypothetical protein
MPAHAKEAQTYTDLMRQHGFFVPDTGDERADYRRMVQIAMIIGKTRRSKGLPTEPCSACGQRKSGCWADPDSGDQLCVNQPDSIDFGEEGDEEGDDSDW